MYTENNFETPKPKFDFSSVGSKLKNIFSSPLLYVGFGIVLLVIFLIRGRSSTSSTPYESSTGSVSSGIDENTLNSALENITTAVSEQINVNNKQLYDDIGEELNSIRKTTTDSISSTSVAVKSMSKKLDKVSSDIDDSKPVVKSEYEIQKEATQKIDSLKKKWMDTNTVYMADGKLSETEKKVLEGIHLDAEKIGIDSGLGAGGDDGSKRKSVY